MQQQHLKINFYKKIGELNNISYFCKKNKMENQFVSSEIAFKLKEKGFLNDCLGFYYYDGSFQKYRLVYNESSDEWVKTINAPLWQQVIDWFRTEHNIDINIFVGVTHDDATPIQWITWITKIDGLINSDSDCNFEIQKPTFEEARQAAIEHTLTLI